ncbi:hypothetical protein ACIBVL_35265 [Streptomyces sp. NPDC049687]|uniref:hypothetical protein n=1 Tax=Streptomyces sp. NPDC049687 TaxID=3365596 RepID=UPI0037A7981D
MTSSAWGDQERDFVALADYNADGAADMTYRTAASNLVLRKGVLGSDGEGAVLTSPGTSAAGLAGDSAYASGSFTYAAYPLVYGTPDVTGGWHPRRLDEQRGRGPAPLRERRHRRHAAVERLG